MSKPLQKKFIAWGMLGFAVLLFVLDVPFPRGVTPAALYVAVVLASLWMPGNRSIWIAAAGCTLLTVLAFFWSEPGPAAADLFNRTFAILAIWAVAFFCLFYKRAEQRTLELAAIVESSGDAILRNNLEGAITSWNPAAQSLFGYAAEEMIGRRTAELFAPEQRDQDSSVLDSVRKGAPVAHFEAMCVRKDGTRMPVALSLSPIFNSGGDVVAIATIARDVTEHKRAAEAQLAKEAAEAASRAKSEFLASMSHEIRTPMNGVFGMLDLTLGTELQPEQRHYLERAKASADLLLRVINDILDFSKIEAGRLDLEPTVFSLRESLGETMKGFGPQAHRKGLELALHVRPDTPERLFGDVLRLVQILTNLVGNAIKFTEKGEVLLDAYVDSASANEVRLHFTVTDTGPGIPPDKQRLIFGAFAQADSSMARRFGGTGLGLAISTRLVDLMGGRIWVESEVGKGSTFHFTVNFALPSEEAAKPEIERIDLEGLPVLAADDNETNRRILTEMLGNWRMKPTTVSGGRDALAELKRAARAGEPFPLVLLDAVMPDLDGFAVAHEIKKDPALADATIMMLSSLDSAGELQRCRELGITACLRKPFKQSELLNAVLKSLGTSLAEPEFSPALAPASSISRPLHILVAEDNQFNQDVVTSLLKKLGHTTALAGSGAEALAAWENGRFDLILMDVQMPEMDGLSATQAIREKEKNTSARVPIVALTAHAMKGDRERCLAAGMDAYVSKPIKTAELFTVIESLFSGRDISSRDARSAASSETVFDVNTALAGIGGDQKLLYQMIEWFLDQSPKLIAKIRDAAAQGDSDAMARAAHTLKSQVGSFGAQAAFQETIRLEDSANAKDLAGCTKATADLEVAVARLQQALAEFVGTKAAKS